MNSALTLSAGGRPHVARRTTIFVAGAVLAGTLVYAGIGLLGGVVLPTPAPAARATAFGVLALTLGAVSFRPDWVLFQPGLQVNREVVGLPGLGPFVFGAAQGVGFITVVSTAAVWPAVVTVFLSGSVCCGVVFGSTMAIARTGRLIKASVQRRPAEAIIESGFGRGQKMRQRAALLGTVAVFALAARLVAG